MRTQLSNLYHHHVVPLARISLTLSRHFSLSFIASGRSSGLHPVSHSCWMYVRAGCPAFAWPYVGVHRSTSLMSSPLLLQQCPACLTWIVFVMGGRWPYSWCLVRCCHQDFFDIPRSFLVQLPSSFFFIRFISIQVVHPYSSIDTTAAWKKLRFILSVRSYITDLSVCANLKKNEVSHCVVSKELDFNLKVSEFKLKLYYYIQFCSNIIGKGMTPLIPHLRII